MKTDLVKKEMAIKLRRKGKSIRGIEKLLGVRRSTLSGWLCNIELTKGQKEKLHQKWLSALVKARLKAAEINKNGRLERIEKIKREIRKFMLKVKIDKTVGELMLAVFYLAEGTKRENSIVIANSNPEILKAFLNLFRYLYQSDKSKFRCCLHLRKDQPEEQLKNYWSRILDIPKSQFHKTQFDKRTVKPTFKNYKGVCVVIYFDMNLQRRLLYMGEELLQMINKIHWARSSVG
ncbi:hypothetical protein KJ636_01115 [Patescibacteria group bacterium]|nr:hypothetical protein [Patescibacteria group bacterium]MBU4480966.1 hypothetical protein [Patescibacteria group bacterium]